MATNFLQIAQEWLEDAEVPHGRAASKAVSLASLLQDTCDDFLLEMASSPERGEADAQDQMDDARAK